MNDFQGFRFPLVRQERSVSGGATNEDITIGPVPPGHMWVITNLSLEDETTNFTSVRVAITGYGEDHHLIEDTSLLAGVLYWYDGHFYLPEGRYLRVRFVGTTSADVLTAYLNGFDVIQPEGAPHA